MYEIKHRNQSLLFALVVSLLSRSANAAIPPDGTGGSIPPSTGGDFSITHHTVDAGYEEMTGGKFRLRGIVGQAEAGISESNDTVFVSGFISTDVPLFSRYLFRDSFEDQ